MNSKKKRTKLRPVTQEQVNEFCKYFRRAVRYLVVVGILSSGSDDELFDPVGAGVPWIIGDDLGNRGVFVGPGVDFAAHSVADLQCSLHALCPKSVCSFRVELHNPTIFLIPEFGRLPQAERMCPEIYMSDTPKDYWGVSGSEMDEWIAFLRGFPESVGN